MVCQEQEEKNSRGMGRWNSTLLPLFKAASHSKGKTGEPDNLFSSTRKSEIYEKRRPTERETPVQHLGFARMHGTHHANENEKKNTPGSTTLASILCFHLSTHSWEIQNRSPAGSSRHARRQGSLAALTRSIYSSGRLYDVNDRQRKENQHVLSPILEDSYGDLFVLCTCL